MARRVAIIGAGIGAQHLAGYMRLPDRYEVAALCDLDAGRAEQVLSAAGSEAPATTDMAQVLADPSVELIDICLPPHLHYPVACDALKAGKHVICEKPLVGSLAEADELTEVSETAQRRVFPIFQYRYGPGLDALRALIDAGLAGRPFVASLETHWNRAADYYEIPWRGTWAGEAGGCVLSHAIHAHDILTSVFGGVETLSADVATRVNAIETEDCAAIRFTMESGALATSSITLGAAGDESRLRFVFEGLTATSGTNPYAPAEGAWTFAARGKVTQQEIDAVLARATPRHCGYAGCLEAVADALDGSPGREVTLADGRASIALVSAIYLSARCGERVALPIDPGSAIYDGWLPEGVAD